MKNISKGALWALLFVLSTPQLSSLMAQEKTIYIREFYDDKTLELLLFDLSMNYQLDFVFDRDKIRGTEIKSMNIKGLDLETAMKAYLKGTNLDFHIENGRTVHIYPYDKKEEVEYVASTRNNINVSGWIYDQNTNETLPYATASIPGIPSGSIANVDGHFILMEVPSDTSTVAFSFLGYETQNIRLNPETAEEDQHIYMKPVDYRIEEVMIVGEEKKLLTYADKTSQISLRPAQIEILPNLGEKDIFRTLQLMPGVSSGNETSSGLHVRGGTPDQNLILLDGFTVYHVDHFYGFLSAFNADAIKDVQLYKGGFESKYGGKISSVMELTGKTGNTNKVSGGVSISALSGSMHLEVPVSEKLNFFVAGRRSYTDFIQSGLYNKINEMYNSSTEVPDGGGFARFSTDPKFYFYDLNSKVTYKPNEKDILTFSFYNGKDVLDKTSDATTRTGMFGGTSDNYNMNRVDVLNWGNWGASTKWSRQWTDRYYSNTTLAFSNYFSERDNYMERTVMEDDGSTSVTTNGSVEDNNILDYTLRMDNEYRLTQNNTLEFGMQASYMDVGYYYTQNDTLEMIDSRTKGLSLAGYLQDKIYIKDKLTLVYGLRSTWYNLTNKVYLEPRTSVNYKLNDRWNLKASWGKYYQYTNRVVRENVLEGNRDFWLLADDKTIPVSSAYHYIAGISYEAPRYLVDVEVFYKPMNGLSEYTMRNESFRMQSTSSLPDNFYEGSGTAKGFEVLLQKKFGSYTGWIAYTYSRVEYQFDELNNGEPYPSIYDQPHEINFVNTYQWGNWVLGATFVYNTGQTYTAPVGAYQLTLLDGTVADFIHVGDKNGYRLPAYHRLDLSVTYRFTLGQTKSNLGFSFFNVYGRDNVWYREFDVEDNEIIITDVNTLGFTPNVFFSIKF